MFITHEHDMRMNMAPARAATKETDLQTLDDALRAFQRETGLRTEKRRVEFLLGRQRVDAVVRIQEPAGPIEYLVEIRKNLRETTLGQLVQRFAQNPGKWIVIAPYVPAYLAKRMRELGLQFIDAAGNAFIHEPPLMIFLHGNRAKEPVREQGEEGLLATGGIRILFALLCQPKLLQATYRELGEAAGTALGTVAGVMKDLTRDGYLLDRGTRGKRLVRREELIVRWTRAYAQRFRKQQLIGRFATEQADLWKDLQLAGRGALWGGEVAAQKLTHHLKPVITTLYAHKPIDTLIVDLRLRRDDRGTIELRNRFWRFKVAEPAADTVPPLLVYADLLATADARNIETAQTIYERFLAEHIE
jgi:hypothetical protein